MYGKNKPQGYAPIFKSGIDPRAAGLPLLTFFPAADAERSHRRLHRGFRLVRFLRAVHSAAGHHRLRSTESEQGPRNIDGGAFRAAACCRGNRGGGIVLRYLHEICTLVLQSLIIQNYSR